LYDRLVAQELLAEAPSHAEMIDVGKEPRRQRR
jgi:siroheme synthase